MTAGGTATGSLGTSSPGILAALRAALLASAGSGVVVLFDLGSAALALEVALEELTDVDRARIAVSDGPLVEGAVRAAVEAAGGNISAAARQLGVSRNTIYRRLRWNRDA